MKLIKLFIVFILLFTIGNYTIVAQEESLETKKRVVQKKNNSKVKVNEGVKRKRSAKNIERRANSKSKVKAARKRLAMAKKNNADGAMTSGEKARKEAKIAGAEKRLKAIEESLDKKNNKN